MAYDIFISYRRSGGKELARSIKSELERRGYRVFLDFDELKDGIFDRRIMDAIDSSPIFMIILSPHALDRCKDKDDWVRKEIEYALERKRHFIPVNPDLKFDGFPTELPDALKLCLGQHQFSEVMFGQLFMASVDKVVSERIEPLLSKLRHTQDNAPKQIGAIYHIETDLECRIYKFDKEIGVVRPGIDTTICLRKGRHRLSIISTECSDDRLSIIQKVEDNDMEDILTIELLPVREKRLQAEAECSRIEKEKKHHALSILIGSVIETKRRQAAYNIEMVYVAGGTFTMGASDYDSEAHSCEKPAHSITLSDYYIGKYEVTQKQWVEIMGSNPSWWKGDNLPVENVSWNDIQEFLRKLNAKTGKNYRLPTEAEWEFAARGRNSSRNYKYSGSNDIGTVAWYDGNSGDKTHPVGTKQPNELGIYDMTGNVLEWCHDWFDSNYYSKSPSSNPKGPSSGASRVLRGGSWNFSARYSRVPDRSHSTPDDRYSFSGFRLASSL